MTALLPFLSHTPGLLCSSVAVALCVYMVLITVLSLTAAYSSKSARRKAAADMVRVLWLRRRGE